MMKLFASLPILIVLSEPVHDPTELHSKISITKVIVPSIYKEFETDQPPQWLVDRDFQKKHGYTVVHYQKFDPRKLHYISANRGTEGGVYLRYIVDHYYNFPDVALFVHANPAGHQEKWFDYFQCVKPSITYASINFEDAKGEDKFCRDTSWFDIHATHVEQCWRDVLRFVWHLQMDPNEFYHRLPVDKPINVCFHPCNQFFLSREQVQKRTLNEWKEILHMLGEDSVCHRGEPDYEHLYDWRAKGEKRGPEPVPEEADPPEYHFTVQGWTSEHLGHVLYGMLDLEAPAATHERLCEHIYPKSVCPPSPCEG